ncbi:MAG: glycosyltransferase, partial [Deltaproteobacteria bacterium]
CDPGRVVRIEGALDFDRWKKGRDRLRRELGIGADVPVAGIVARMKKGRGHELLIAAWRRVLEILPDAVLLMVGRGELRHQLEKKVESMGLSRSVVFCGYRQDLENVYPAFDLKVMLAPGNDGTCRAALEAMACGVPLAAAPVGALEDIVEEGKTGWLLRAQAPEELGERLAGLLRDREALKSAGQNARRVAMERFTVERQLERVMALYERCLA